MDHPIHEHVRADRAQLFSMPVSEARKRGHLGHRSFMDELFNPRERPRGRLAAVLIMPADPNPSGIRGPGTCLPPGRW